MAFICKDLCYKMQVENNSDANYSDNKKYCSVYNKFYFIHIPRCPCCGTMLRVDRKNKNRRRRKYF